MTNNSAKRETAIKLIMIIKEKKPRLMDQKRFSFLKVWGLKAMITECVLFEFDPRIDDGNADIREDVSDQK